MRERMSRIDQLRPPLDEHGGNCTTERNLRPLDRLAQRTWQLWWRRMSGDGGAAAAAGTRGPVASAPHRPVACGGGVFTRAWWGWVSCSRSLEKLWRTKSLLIGLHAGSPGMQSSIFFARIAASSFYAAACSAAATSPTAAALAPRPPLRRARALWDL